MAKTQDYALGGIAGQKFDKSFVGWPNQTVGPAGSVEHSLQSQIGIQPNDPALLSFREPIRTGRFIVKWLKFPPFFHPKAIYIMKRMFEDSVKGVSGIPENSIDRIDQQDGTIRRPSSHPGIYNQQGNEITFTVPEYAGSLCRKLLEYWLYGISDKDGGHMHMYGKALRGVQGNIAGSFIYIVLGPTCRPDDIEFACMLNECIPYSEKASHLDSTLGEAGSGVELSIPFAGFYQTGPSVDILAKHITEAVGLYGETFLNGILPSYIYTEYLQKSPEELRAKLGVTVDARLKDPAMTQVYTESVKETHATNKATYVPENYIEQNPLA